jgi:hypothetical protein
MKARELIADLPLGPGDQRQALLSARLLLCYLADHACMAELQSGQRISDLTDVKVWLRELAEAARVPSVRTSPRVTSCDFCPDCGHVHIDDSECGFPIGGGRNCRCERAVRA